MKTIEQVQFSRWQRRRFNKRAKFLISLYKENKNLFRREWRKQVQGWLNEVHRRAAAYRQDSTLRRAENMKRPGNHDNSQNFGVLAIAEAVLTACGEDIEKMIGKETRQLLKNECRKAVAGDREDYLKDPRNPHLYRRPGTERILDFNDK